MFSSSTWLLWNTTLLIIILFGGFSCVRPACDIFIAGVTQSIPVFYLQYCFYKTFYCLKTTTRFNFWVLIIGAILNAPLIVLYPHLLEWYGAAITNCLLHLNLLTSWGLQGYGYYLVLKCNPQFNVKKRRE